MFLDFLLLLVHTIQAMKTNFNNGLGNTNEDVNLSEKRYVMCLILLNESLNPIVPKYKYKDNRKAKSTG